MRRALAAEVEEVGALAGGEHALDDGAGRDAERLAEVPGLRPLRQFPRAGLLAGVGDVADALAGKFRQLRTGFEHHDPGIRDPLEQHPGVGGADRPAADDGDGGVVRHGGLLRVHAVSGSDAGSGRGSCSSESRPGQQDRGDDAHRIGEGQRQEDGREHVAVDLRDLRLEAGGRSWTSCGVSVEASRIAGRLAATPKPITPPMTAVATVDPTWRTRLMVAVIVPVSFPGTAPCTTATMRLMNAPVPTPTTTMTIIGTHSGGPTGSSAIAKSPTAPSVVPMIGKTR